MKPNKLIPIIIACAVGLAGHANAEEFRKLSGAQIRAKLTGMQLTDESHWVESYSPSGKFTSDEMGNIRTGLWQIVKDQFCKTYNDEKKTICYEVWISMRTLQMKIPGSSYPPFEGVLERMSNRR
ncbi:MULTISPECIES: hypothetical protein [Hyphomicrobiales]|jgi:hypothetical protein|uniref:hypothetical protein n=1 Tax=Hyphomicrobiales TaxID=356 RepID=UPI000368D434|nr:hypothetical protein [Afipia birgiae]